MATRDTGQPASGITRRDFLKTTAAATAAVGCGLEFAYDPEKAQAYENSSHYKVTFTTCPYCSASCGQRVVTATNTHPDTAVRGTVVDIYGDFESPINTGGLCAKGAGGWQLVTNPRRIGAWEGSHPVDDVFAADPSYTDGVAYKRVGNGPWTKEHLPVALADIAGRLVSARGALPANNNSKGVAFFGSSHMNNESNYLYRKVIANFGTSNTEHQARI